MESTRLSGDLGDNAQSLRISSPSPGCIFPQAPHPQGNGKNPAAKGESRLAISALSEIISPRSCLAHTGTGRYFKHESLESGPCICPRASHPNGLERQSREVQPGKGVQPDREVQPGREVSPVEPAGPTTTVPGARPLPRARLPGARYLGVELGRGHGRPSADAPRLGGDRSSRGGRPRG